MAPGAARRRDPTANPFGPDSVPLDDVAFPPLLVVDPVELAVLPCSEGARATGSSSLTRNAKAERTHLTNAEARAVEGSSARGGVATGGGARKKRRKGGCSTRKKRRGSICARHWRIYTREIYSRC